MMPYVRHHSNRMIMYDDNDKNVCYRIFRSSKNAYQRILKIRMVTRTSKFVLRIMACIRNVFFVYSDAFLVFVKRLLMLIHCPEFSTITYNEKTKITN